MGEESERIDRALAAIDAASAKDPEGRAVLYGERMSAWLARLVPDAGEALRIAVRAQHLERWKIPRSARPEGRVGYLRWRSELAAMHAQRVGEILREVGYEEGVIERVQSIVQKKRVKSDPDAQALEDCACMVFLEHEMEAFIVGREDAQVIDIVRKTWAKMSERARAAALEIAPALAEISRELVTRALDRGRGDPEGEGR